MNKDIFSIYLLHMHFKKSLSEKRGVFLNVMSEGILWTALEGCAQARDISSGLGNRAVP